MTSKDFAIGVLSVTAVILLVGLIILNAAAPQTALASGQSGTVGEYVVTTSSVDAQCEILCILDTSVQRLNFYQLDPITYQVVRIRSIDVRAQQPAGGRPGAGQRRR